MKKDKIYLGHETWLNAVRMYVKMIVKILLYSFIIHLAIFFVSIYLFMPTSEMSFLLSYVKARWVDLLFLNPLTNLDRDHFDQAAIEVWERLVVYFIRTGIPTYVVSIPALLLYFSQRARKQAKDKVVRGSILITPRQLIKAIEKDREVVDLPIGPIKLPKTAEVKQTLIIGSPGVGKTNAINAVIERVIERNEKAVIYDYKGDYVSKFYDPATDVILNPLDTRFCGWTIISSEISRFSDVDMVAHSLIPTAFQQDPYWNDAARDVFSGLLQYLYQNNSKTNADLWAAVTSPIATIADWLKNTLGGEKGYVYIQDASSKQAMSVVSVMMQYVKSFEYMSKVDGPFKISEWLTSPEGGRIFITGFADIKDTLRPILSLAVDLIGKRLLSMPDNYDKRVHIILDEFGTLQRLSSIIDILTGSRSKGGAVILGIQDKGQIDKIYSPQVSQTILSACGNSIMFRVADPTTAKYLSERIGKAEVTEVDQTLSTGVTDLRDGVSLAQRIREKDVVMPSEIMDLRDLEAYLKIANYHVSKVNFSFKKREVRHEPFIIRDDLLLDNILKE